MEVGFCKSGKDDGCPVQHLALLGAYHDVTCLRALLKPSRIKERESMVIPTSTICFFRVQVWGEEGTHPVVLPFNHFQKFI